VIVKIPVTLGINSRKWQVEAVPVWGPVKIPVHIPQIHADSDRLFFFILKKIYYHINYVIAGCVLFSTVFPLCHLPSQINVFPKRVKSNIDTNFILTCTGTGTNLAAFFDTGIEVRTGVAIRQMVFVLDCFGKKK
jgi:hypothetical protein